MKRGLLIFVNNPHQEFLTLALLALKFYPLPWRGEGAAAQLLSCLAALIYPLKACYIILAVNVTLDFSDKFSICLA